MRRSVRTSALVLPLGLVLAGPGQARAAEASEETAPVSTEPEPPAPPEEPPAPSERWSPPPPDPESFDWLRLVSGEWVKGEIDLMRDETLYFDSEELDDLQIDWDDIAELRSPRVNTYLFEDRVVHTGTAVMRDGVILVQGGEEVWEYSREEIVGIVAGGVSEWDHWHFRLGAGLSARSGNTDQVDITGDTAIRREDALTRLLLTYSGAVGSINDELNTNTHRADGEFDVYLSRRLYWIVEKTDVFSDEFQNVNVRVTPSTGVGYTVVDRKSFEWSLELGAGYQWTRFESVTGGSSDLTDSTFALIPGTSLDFDITQRLEFEGSYFAQLGIPDTSESNQHATGLLSFEITDILDLDVSFTWDRVEDPPQDSDGNVPEKNDYRLSVGLAVELN